MWAPWHILSLGAQAVQREAILTELIHCLIRCNRYREALDELELYVHSIHWNVKSDEVYSYLPSFPFQDNPILHVYSGLLSLYLSQEKSEGSIPIVPNSARLTSCRHVTLLNPAEGSSVSFWTCDRTRPGQLGCSSLHKKGICRRIYTIFGIDLGW